MLSEKVGRAAYVPICLSLVVPVLAVAANWMLTVHRDGWFIKMILEHDATLVSLSHWLWDSYSSLTTADPYWDFLGNITG